MYTSLSCSLARSRDQRSSAATTGLARTSGLSASSYLKPVGQSKNMKSRITGYLVTLSSLPYLELRRRLLKPALAAMPVASPSRPLSEYSNSLTPTFHTCHRDASSSSSTLIGPTSTFPAIRTAYSSSSEKLSANLSIARKPANHGKAVISLMNGVVAVSLAPFVRDAPIFATATT